VAIPEREREQFLEMIETEAERLRAIIAQLLVAGSLDADSLSLAIRPVDLDPLVRDVVAAAEVGKPEPIRFDYRAPRTPVVALAAGELLRQVLANVVDNAVKYSPCGGDVRLTLTRFRGRARVAVADEGIGIPPETQARIFEKFVRADPSLTRGI